MIDVSVCVMYLAGVCEDMLCDGLQREKGVFVFLFIYVAGSHCGLFVAVVAVRGEVSLCARRSWLSLSNTMGVFVIRTVVLNKLK